MKRLLWPFRVLIQFEVVGREVLPGVWGVLADCRMLLCVYREVCVCVCVFMASFALNFICNWIWDYFSFLLAHLTHTHRRGEKATSGLNGSLAVIGSGKWRGRGRGSGSGRNRKERGTKRIKRGRWNEKLSYKSRLHVWTSFVSTRNFSYFFSSFFFLNTHYPLNFRGILSLNKKKYTGIYENISKE